MHGGKKLRTHTHAHTHITKLDILLRWRASGAQVSLPYNRIGKTTALNTRNLFLCYIFFWYHLSRLSSRFISIPSPFAFFNAELILALWLLCSNLNFLISEPPHLFHIACSCNFSASSALSSQLVMSFLYLPGQY